MESKSPAVTVASVTNASATPHYYPSAAGLPLGHAERLVLQIVCSGGVTLTFEVSDDNSTWTDVTKSLTSLNTGSTATSYVDKSDLLVFEGALFAQWRVKCVCSDATNAISIVATTAAGVVTKSGGGGGGGTVTGVTATAPIAASAGAAPVISWAPTTDVSMSSHKITSLTAGSASTDAVNVAQLQAVTAGITSRSVRVATTVALPAYTYTNGTLGVGAKFTFTSTTSVANTYTDGVTVNVGDRILVKNETGANRGYHGLYIVTQRGDSILATDIWTRVTDCDTAAELASLDVRVDVGTTLAGQLWCSYNDPDTFVVGSTVQIFIAAGVAAHASTHAIGASDALPAASTSVAGIIQIGTDATEAMAGNTALGISTEAQLRALAATITAPLDLGSSSTPTASTHAVRVAEIMTPVGWPVKACATANVASLTGTGTFDDVACAAGDIVFLPLQTTLSQNGPWVVAAGAWTRPVWYPTGGTAAGLAVSASTAGTVYGGSRWRCCNAGPSVIDTNNTIWSLAYQAVTPFPVDANTLYYWQCAEPGGNILYDSGPSANNVTLSGVLGTAYTRTQQATPGQYQIHNLTPSGVQIAVPSITIGASSSFSIDAVLQFDLTYYDSIAACFGVGSSQNGASNDLLFCFTSSSTVVCTGSGVGGSFVNGASMSFVPGGAFIHVGMAWTDNVGYTAYFNGVAASPTARAVHLAQMNYGCVGCDLRTAGGRGPMRGTICNMHISNIARPASYFQRQYLYAAKG